MLRSVLVGLALLFLIITLYVICGLLFRLPLIAIDALTGRTEIAEWGSVLFPIFLVVAFHKDWLAIPRPYQCRGDIWIDASPSAVWDHVRPRARSSTFHSGFDRIDACPGEPDRFDLVIDGRMGDEGVPVPDRLQVRITEEEPKAYLQMKPLNAAAFPLFAKDNVQTEYFLTPEDGGTRVTMKDTLSRITPVMIIAFLYMNPARDGLKRLKAFAEGTPDPSRMGAWMEELDGEGVPGPEVRRTLNFAAGTVIVGSLFLLFGVLALVFRLMPPQ